MSEETQVRNRILVTQHVGPEDHVLLDSPITEVDDFDDDFQMLAGAGDRDLIKFDIVTPGGSMDTAHMLVRAIHRTAAHTVAYIGPTCASAGTAIALACEEWEIDEMSSFMIHTGSYGYVGMAPHVKANVDHIDKMMERFVRSTYTGFLSEEEIERVLDGREMYFEGEELAQRLVAFSQYRESMREALIHEEVDTDPFSD